MCLAGLEVSNNGGNMKYTEDTLVQQTIADYLQDELGWEVDNDKDPCRPESGDHLQALLERHKAYLCKPLLALTELTKAKTTV